MSSLSFVNINGDRVNVLASAKTRANRVASDAEEFHKGWRVVGIPPGALEEAEKAFEPADGRKFDRDNWLMNAKQKPVRAKPYGVMAAAETCADMAKRAGWLRVTVQEMKREKSGS